MLVAGSRVHVSLTFVEEGPGTGVFREHNIRQREEVSCSPLSLQRSSGKEESQFHHTGVVKHQNSKRNMAH